MFIYDKIRSSIFLLKKTLNFPEKFRVISGCLTRRQRLMVEGVEEDPKCMNMILFFPNGHPCDPGSRI